MGGWSEQSAWISRGGCLLCSGRSSADANQDEWLEMFHFDEEEDVGNLWLQFAEKRSVIGNNLDANECGLMLLKTKVE